MAHQQEDNNSGQMSTDTIVNTTTNDVEGKEPVCLSPSSSEHMDEDDDLFQIEGPILSSQFSLAPADHSAAVSTDECTDPKRIPSSVFERSKSTTPTDWSVASNESLFSISVGNASFSKDHLFLYGKSGEMGNPSDPLAPLPPLIKESQGFRPIQGEVPPNATLEGSSIVKRNAPKEKREWDTDCINSFSHQSDESTTSFAFPILTGDERSNGCLKDNHPELARQNTAQLSHPEQPHGEKNEAPKVAMEAPKPEEAPVPAPLLVPGEPPLPPKTTKMFPWCSCCPFCC
ncbi:unnamed protein product [Alopecurus aequalis]